MTRPDAPDNDRTHVILREGAHVFGRYALTAMVGAGGMGVVWRARDEKLDRDVALKFLPDRVRDDPEAIRDLKRETNRCLSLTHENIVRVYDFVEDDLVAAIAMEFVPGRSLSALKAARPGGCLDAADLMPLVAQLCAALDYAHTQAKVVHHDLKPANLLVTPDGVLKVADFGIARSLRETTTRRTGVTQTPLGTLAYMGPQQLKNKSAHPTDDVYALGATLYDLLTGKPPFYAGDLATQIREEPPAPLAGRRVELGNSGAAIPAEWETTILACLAKRAEDRPVSVAAVRATLGGGDTGDRTLTRSPFASEPSLTTVRRKPKIELTPPGAPRPRPAAAEVRPREFVVTVEPPNAGAHLWLGPQPNLPVPAGGCAVVKNLPDGEHELVVQAAGYQPLTMRVLVESGCGRAEARLVAVHGAFELFARAGTVVTAVDARGRETRVGIVPPPGTLSSQDLLTVGTYLFKFTHPDCVEVRGENVELRPNRVARVAPVQAGLPGELRVFSVPSGAEVAVNGKRLGVTPATLSQQPSETELVVEVFARGYGRLAQTVTLKPKETRTVNVGTLAAEKGGVTLRFALANFRWEPPKLTIDGKAVEIGRIALLTRLRVDDLEVGAHSVEISLSGHELWRQSVTVRAQETTAVKVNLAPRAGRRPPWVWVAVAATFATGLIVVLWPKGAAPLERAAPTVAAPTPIPVERAPAVGEAASTAVTAESETGLDASPAFRSFVAGAKITGVYQGEASRAFINGRLARAGETVDVRLGIILVRIEPQNKRIIFKDKTGATLARRY